jgi:hypothetical protein
MLTEAVEFKCVPSLVLFGMVVQCEYQCASNVVNVQCDTGWC